MQRTFVLDQHKRPLMPCHPARARALLNVGKAAVFRRVPFTIILKSRTGGDTQPVCLKLDPGSKTTGIALLSARKGAETVLWAGELTHRGAVIRARLTARRAFRRRRRGNLRHREPRFLNRTRPAGWLAPSLQHRVDTTRAWVKRLCQWIPVTALSQELVRFDTQIMQSPEISGVEYQQGELQGYEVREYLLEKWARKCAYCGAEHVPLEIDHIHPRSKGGSDRVNNLTLACHRCNQKKGQRDVSEYLAHDPQRLAKIRAHARTPLKDAAAVNSTRWALYNALKATGLPVEAGTGGRTKWNRTRLGIPKGHALDAVCVGETGTVVGWNIPTVAIKCTGRGSYQRTRLDRFGFPRGYLIRSKRIKGFATGDIVRAEVPSGTKTGSYVGRVAVRATGSFNIQTPQSIIQGISHRHCSLIQRADGYSYATQPKIALNTKEAARQAA